ncbi:uncharacterized protein LOC100203426 isoform X18 [Hydra vulgaris]|uniref:Uncharacterized protein LOC100203426 isoform X18 n=1 Tax=Hydra vulgaris TaxID=6087 RepID=A0ABM4D813_HYDVU
MRIAVQYIFILTLCGSSHGTSKVKRDISDLKNDPILSSIFAPDKENSRRDRSILNDHHDSNLKKQLLENTDKQKRDADLLPELMTLNSNSNNNEPIISKPIPIPDNDPALLVLDTSQSAVNPSALFANFLPLNSDAQQGSFLSWYPWSGKVNTISNKPYAMSKKSVLPNIFEDINIPLTVDKKDDVPHVHRTSFPVQLRVHSPNENLLGIVPHVPEYGETVASIQTARTLVENTRSSIPHPSDNLAIKAPEDEVIVTKSIIPNTVFTNIPAPATVEKKSVTNEQKRQYIPAMQLNNLFYPQYQQYQIPQYSNYLQYPTINVQQSPIVQPMYPSTIQSLQQQSAISNEPCTDQYPMCTGFAKNNYCFNYPDLMKIQCRKSCGHCIPLLTPVETVIANDTTPNVENQSKSAVIKAANGKDSKKSNDKGSKLTEKVKKVKSKSKIATTVVHKKPNEKLKTQTIKHEEFDGKATVSTSKYKNEGIDEEDSGSGSSGSGLDAEGESGLSEESGSGVNTVNTKSFNVSKILITKNNTKLHTTVKKLLDAKIQGTEKKSRRSKIPDKKQISHPEFSEFKLPVKKSVIPVSSLALADKNGDDIDSGSGDSLIETASTKSKIVSNVTEKSSEQQSAKPLPKVLIKTVKKKNSKSILINVPKSKNKNIGHSHNVSIIAKPKSKKQKIKKQGVNIKIVHKEKKNKAKTKRNQHKISVVKKNKGEKNVTVKVENKSTKNKTNITKKDEQIIVKKQEISQRPENANSAIFASKYPRIDLRAIANALAKYESAALELAGEYPKPAQFDMTEYQRSSIPRPETLYVNNIEQNIQIAELVTKTERDKKNIIPKYLKLSTDVFKDGDSFLDTENADSLDSVRRRFEIPGIEPTLNDYYSETGKINPFSSKQSRYKKSQIMKIKTMNTSSDPYEYLRNMPPGASMEPIEDPRKRSNIPSDHSFPVFLMKVSPADQKYKPEEASKRGKVHHLNAEGLPIDDKENGNNNAPIASSPVEDHHATQQNFVNSALVSPMNIPSYPQAMQFVSPPYMQPGFFQYPGVPALSEEHAAVSPPIGFTVEQLTAPRTSAAFAHEDQVTAENQPKDSLRSKMLSAFFTVKNGEGVSDEGSGGTSNDKIGKSNLVETGSGDGNEDAQKPVISLHNLLKNDLLLSDDKSSNIGKSSSSKSPSNNQQDSSANYLRSNLAALTPESGKSNTDEQSVMSGEHAMSTKMRKTQETNWMRPNPESELASALPESYIDSSDLNKVEQQSGNELEIVPKRKIKGNLMKNAPGDAHISNYLVKKHSKEAFEKHSFHLLKPLHHDRFNEKSINHLLTEAEEDANLSSKFKDHKLNINFNKNPAYHDNRNEYDSDRYSIFDSQKSKIRHKLTYFPGKGKHLSKFINNSTVNFNILLNRNFPHEYNYLLRPLSIVNSVHKKSFPSIYIPANHHFERYHPVLKKNLIQHTLKNINHGKMKTASNKVYFRQLSNKVHTTQSSHVRPQNLIDGKYIEQPVDLKTVLKTFLQSQAKGSLGYAFYDKLLSNGYPKKIDSKRRKVAANSKSVPSKETSSHQNSLNQAFLMENASPRDQIPSKYITTKKAIMQADMVRGQPTSDITKKFINQKKVLSKNLFESFPSQDIAITHLKDDIDKSILMEFPKSPFSSHNVNSFPKEANNPLNTKRFVNKNLLISLNSKSSQNNQNDGNSNRDEIPNFNRDNIQNNIPYLWRQYSNSIVPSTSVASESPDFQMPVQVSFSKQESSLLSAKVGSAKYEQNPIAQIVASKQLDAGSSQNYLNQPGVAVQPLLHNTIESKKQTITQGVRKNLIKQQPDLDCGDDWEGARGDFGTFCYKEIKVKATFDDALAECRRLKGDLFSILNAYENRYLQDNIHERFWIGYRDKGMDGNWNWTDGSKSIYTNWANNADGDDSKRFDCVYVEADQGLWKDAPCNKKQPFLCKKKKEVCPKDWKNLKLNSANGCYKLFETSLGWEDAEHECEKNHSHLASLTSEDEQTMVYQVHSSKSFWIGFNDRENEGDWMWSDRTTSSYTNWAERAPTNGGLSCTSMIDGGKWHDEPCGEKYKFVCKRKGPQPEKNEGLDSDGVLLPVARLMMRPETSPSHIYDDIAKGGLHPVTPKFFWPLLKISKSGLAGNRPMAAHGGVRVVPGGVALDGIHGFLDGGDFHGKCLADPKKCIKGFTIAIHVYFDKIVRQYKKEHCVIDTSGGGKGFTIFIANNKLNYKVVTDEQTWHLQTDLTVEIWEQIVMTWHKDKGLSVFVNGAFKDAETTSKKSVIVSNGPTRLIVGREDKDKGPYSCTKMVVASVAIFTKMLSIEDVPYAFTYGDTVVASYRWLMSGVQESVIPGAPEIEVKNTPTDIDGGIFIDGAKNWLEIDELDPMISDVYSKAKHGFAISFKIKFDQRVREYKEPRYVIDSGGHVGGIRGVSVFVVNDNLYFQVIDSPDEDVLIWKVRVPVYTVRWQRVMMSWRLDKGLWVYLDGAFRGFTKTPITLPEEIKEIPKKLVVGRKIIGPDYAGAQFAFGCLAVYGRYLSHKESSLVFGGADNPFPGIIREVWKNLPGENITVLEKNPDYPNNPTTIEIIENFDAPFNVDNDYGSKVKGYFIAPETGNTTFYLSCSKSCKLFFSADEESKNKTVIISLNKPTWHNQWNKYANQSSKEIYLVAGKFYFLEAIQKGVDASDSLSVGVRMPTGRYQRPISIENLQWRLPGNQHAGLIREVWYNIPGYSISDLTSNINFPSKPSSTEVLDKFDAPFNVDDNYGSRISGYFRAPDTGDYRFYLATDSSGELWLSSDDSESNLVKLITLNGWTDHNQWLKYPEQRSEKIFLVSGQYYFIRVYMKADKLGDCASVAVELPSGHFEGPIKKKHLSWKLTSSKEGPGPKEIIEPLPKPVGLFALNDASVKDILLPGENKIILGDVDLTSGPTGLKDDAFLFKGNRSSYIEIPNDGKLDVKHSLTILANIYPMGEDGPIINFKRDGWGVHLWQFSKTQLFVRFVTREGKMSMQPLGTRVLQLNKWNQVGATYDKSSGVAQLWHDGKMVKSRNIGQVDLLTNAPIRLGAREGDDRFFKGKISCIQIYDRALSADQIGEVKHCPKQSKGSPIDIDDLTVFAQGSGIGPRLEESESVENRIGEDTEEELIVTRCDPSPCLNSGECIDDDKKIDGYKCICTSDFTGKHCQVSKPAAENPVMKRTIISYIKKGEEPIKQTTSKADESLLLYQKIGCYKDDFLNSDLKIKIPEISNLTQDHCVRACAKEDNSSSYFGLQNGVFCFCGNKYGKYGKIADSFCNKVCPGNSEENCGGEFANNLFFFGRSKNYTIKTFTGKQQGAGTDAKIYVELLGDRGNSDFRQLDNAIDKYEPGSADQQTFALPDLGNLKRVRILHDNSGSAPSWFLSKVEVTDELGHTEEFPCNDWLSETQSGGKLERDLFAKSIISKPS